MFDLPKELEELKQFKNWVCYVLEPRATKADPNHLGKVPYNPETGAMASANDPGTWTDYQTAVRSYVLGRYDGIGFELGNSPYCGIDIDNCVVNGVVSPAAQKVVDHIDSYTELSISGTGLHIIAKSAALEKTGYMAPKGQNENDLTDLEVYRPIEKTDGSFVGEVKGGRFLTISGKVYSSRPIAERTAAIKGLVRYYWTAAEKPSAPSSPVGSVGSSSEDADKRIVQAALNCIDPAKLEFNEWAAVISAMKACGFTADDAEAWSASGANPKNRSGYVRQRWEKFHLPNEDNYGAAGVIINRAKQFNFNPASVFTDEERRQYGIEQHLIRDAEQSDPEPEKASPVEVEAPRQNPKPDNVLSYIDSLMSIEIEQFGREIKTGYENLDNEMGGLYPGLYAIGGISSVGKTTFCAQLGDQIAAGGTDVLYFSLEQSRLELVSKSIARKTAQRDMNNLVNSLDIRKGYLPKAVLDAVEDYRNEVGDRLSIVEGNTNTTVKFVCDYVTGYIKRNGKRPVVIIDYLQILQPADEDRNKQKTVREMVDGTVFRLRKLARDENIVVIAISSVGRGSYLTPVDFESFKESGGIEFSSDVVLGLQLQCMNDEIFDKTGEIKKKRETVRMAKNAKPRRIELVCLKNRYGKIDFTCRFDYYPGADLFIPCNPQYQIPKAGRKAPKR